MKMNRAWLLAALLLGTLPRSNARGQDAERTGLDRFARTLAKQSVDASFRSMNRPLEPFRLIGNISYVGAREVSSFLITTPAGHILIDSGFEATVPLIRNSVLKLGFRFKDIKIVLNSHAHLDHAGGHASLKKLTGATLVMSEADAALMARGGKGDFLPVADELMAYPPARADRIIADGAQVSLGGVTMTAHLTPGHTKGCTTWTMSVAEHGQHYNVVFFGSTTLLPGVRLVDNPRYPKIADDFEHTFRVLNTLPCDVFLAPHGSMFSLEEKARRLSEGAKANPFLDGEGYKRFVTRAEAGFRRQLGREREASRAADLRSP